MRGAAALLLLAVIFVVGVYGVATTAHVEVAIGVLDFPVTPIALYDTEVGCHPVLFGSYYFGGMYVFPVLSKTRSYFVIPRAYGGFASLSLSSSSPVNVSVYYTGSLEGAPVLSAVNVTQLHVAIPQPEDVYFFGVKGMLDGVLFPATSMNAVMLPPFLVVVEGEESVVAAVKGSVFGAQIVQSPRYVFSWALLIFSGVFIALALFGKAASKLTLKGSFESDVHALKLFFYEPVAVALPYALALIPILYVATNYYWALAHTVWHFQKVGISDSLPLPLHLLVAITVVGLVILSPTVFLSRFLVHHSVGNLHQKGSGEGMEQLGGGSLLASLLALSAFFFVLNYLLMRRVENMQSYEDLYAVGELALILSITAIVILLILYLASPRFISSITGEPQKLAGIPLKRFLVKMLFIDAFFLAITVVLGIGLVVLFNPFAYPIGMFYSPIVAENKTVLILSSALLVSATSAIILSIPSVIQFASYVELAAVRRSKGEEAVKRWKI